MTHYGTSSRDYLARADALLRESTVDTLFHAAFELRCGIEARLQECLEPHEHIPLGRRTAWQVGNLHRTATDAFGSSDEVVRVEVHDRATSAHLFTLFYTPVTGRLKDIAQRLGDYLHVAKRSYAAEDAYWDDLRTLLVEGTTLLREATTGTLLGAPLINRATGQSSLPVELRPDENGIYVDQIRALKGRSVVMNVARFSSLSDALAPGS